MSGAVHLLSMAANIERTCVAEAFYRSSGGGDGQGERILAQCEGVFLRRRYLQHPEGTYHRTLREAEAAEHHMVMHLACHHRLRHAQGHARSGMPAADRWI